jgi:hypothetical protein
MEVKEFRAEVTRNLGYNTVDTDDADIEFLISVGERLDPDERASLMDLIIRLMGTYL